MELKHHNVVNNCLFHLFSFKYVALGDCLGANFALVQFYVIKWRKWCKKVLIQPKRFSIFFFINWILRAHENFNGFSLHLLLVCGDNFIDLLNITQNLTAMNARMLYINVIQYFNPPGAIFWLPAAISYPLVAIF